MGQIELKGVTKRYPDGTEAVKSMALEIADGSSSSSSAPSGCGTSTALRLAPAWRTSPRASCIAYGAIVGGSPRPGG